MGAKSRAEAAPNELLLISSCLSLRRQAVCIKLVPRIFSQGELGPTSIDPAIAPRKIRRLDYAA